jgi:hypothetical protein
VRAPHDRPRHALINLYESDQCVAAMLTVRWLRDNGFAIVNADYLAS